MASSSRSGLAELLVETLMSERSALRNVDGWIGARLMDDAHQWITGEPPILGRPWRGGVTGVDECVLRESAMWSALDCSRTRPSLCERTAFPSW